MPTLAFEPESHTHTRIWPSSPDEPSQSPLWAVTDHDDEVGLIDTYADAEVSDVKSVADIVALVEVGWLSAPTPEIDDNPANGDKGQVFWDSPMSVPEGYVPFPCEAND